MLAMRADIVRDPTHIGDNFAAGVARWLFDTYVLKMSIGVGPIECLAAAFRLTGDTVARISRDLIFNVFCVVVFFMMFALAVTRILVNVMIDFLAALVRRTVLVQAPLGMNLMKLIAAVSRVADDPFRRAISLSARALVRRNLNLRA